MAVVYMNQLRMAGAERGVACRTYPDMNTLCKSSAVVGGGRLHGWFHGSLRSISRGHD